MKCKNCGGEDFIKFASHYECSCCGQKWTDEPVQENAVETESDNATTLNETLYMRLRDYTAQFRMNEERFKTTVEEILGNDPADRVAKCLLAFLERDDYPENYKEAIMNLDEAEVDQDTANWLFTFLIENSEYKFYDSIVEILFDKDLYSDFSQLLTSCKKRLEMENEHFSDIPRDVFICYSSNDLPTVEKLVEHLEGDGNSCWYADRNMPRNSLIKTEYKATIDDAISKCKIFLVVMSQNSLLSEDVKWELDAADKYDIQKRIEYRIEDVENTTRFKMFFDGIQWIDASQETQYYVLISRVYDMLHSKENDEVNEDDVNESGDTSLPASTKSENCADDDVPYVDVDEDDEEDDAEYNEEVNDTSADSTHILTPTEVEEQALDLFEQEEYDKAFAMLDKIDNPTFENLTCYYIGLCFEKGYGTDEDPEQAKYFYKLAETGEEHGKSENLGQCFYFLGMKYACGDFFEKSEERAFELFKKAADYKNGSAIFNLGICYKTGKGTEKNEEQAFACFESAQYYLPEEANYQLGICYDEGIGVAKDPAEAVRNYRIAAELGNTKAMSNLGMHYYYGNGVEQDPFEAVHWYQEAAEAGNPIAQYNLGQCYFAGTGVEKDLDFARDWLEKSAKNGNKKAAHFIIDNF